MIPTSIDLDLQKSYNIPTTSTTTFPHKPSVRNTSSIFSFNFPIPITTSLKQNTTNPILLAISPLDPLTTSYRSKNTTISIPRSTLLHSTDQTIPNNNSNNINTKSVTDKKKTNKNVVPPSENVSLFLK